MEKAAVSVRRCGQEQSCSWECTLVRSDLAGQAWSFGGMKSSFQPMCVHFGGQSIIYIFISYRHTLNVCFIVF